MYKQISAGKLQILSKLYSDALREYTVKPKEAAKLLAVNSDVKPQKAALVVVANAMLNLDEIITKN
ncbi:hypothetical protein [Mucilaginibacter sp. SP1R1]|uniref:hypothetical protein n=1 Tax=Mucilaginibacter sp. SP1R1 TaxID=2723091 RepID=UPI003AFFAD57